MKTETIYSDIPVPKLKLVTCNGCELMEDDYHEHCPECDCVLTWLEGDICRWCEERIEDE